MLSIFEPPHKQQKIENTKTLKRCWKKIIKIYQWEESTRTHGKLLNTRKFDSIFVTNEGLICKKNSIWRGKLKIECLRIQLEFFKGFIKF